MWKKTKIHQKIRLIAFVTVFPAGRGLQLVYVCSLSPLLKRTDCSVKCIALIRSKRKLSCYFTLFFLESRLLHSDLQLELHQSSQLSL